MLSLEEKKEKILEYERLFAYRLSGSVLEKPRMSLWMILIPIILVFHIYRHQRYVDGKKEFAENYLITREKALSAAFDAAAAGQKPSIDRIVKEAQIPEDTRDAYAEWVSELTSHYFDLLQAEGGSVDEMVRGVFRSRTNYQLFLRRLGNREHRFHAALQPSIEQTTPGAGQIIGRMESGAQTLRNEHAQAVFP